MAIITKFTDYAIKTPDWFIDFIKTEITQRDVRGLTGGRITAVNITGEHPLVSLTKNMLESGGSELDVSGFLPAIAVVEADENEQYTTIGDGKRVPIIVDQAFVDTCRAVPIAERDVDGLVSDKQLASIEQAIANTVANSPTGEGAVIAELEGFFLRETTFVSVWCHNVNERNTIGNVVRSILYDMKKAMRAAKLKDTYLKTAKGLVNTNFGQVLHGQETTLDYINFFHNITVTDEFPTKIMLDNCAKISIYDAIEQSTEELCTMIEIDPAFRPAGYSEQGAVDIHEGDVIDE